MVRRVDVILGINDLCRVSAHWTRRPVFHIEEGPWPTLVDEHGEFGGLGVLLGLGQQ